MATINQDVTLKHQANLGEEVAEISFSEGDPVTVLKEWAEHYLCKNDEGKVFNVEKFLIDA